MSALKLGVIGTSWITEKFINDAEHNGHYQLAGIYSRKLETAQNFAKKFNGDPKTTTNLEELFDAVEIVYIASPNAFHFQHVLTAIEKDVHVIVEKPAFINPDEFQVIEELLASHPKIYFFEAARHIHTKNFKLIKNALADFGEVSGANLNFQQFSSKYPDYQKDLKPNVFSLEYGGGALYDLGVYVVYAALSWFGIPRQVGYIPTLLSTGADGRGQINFVYDRFFVSATISKINTSNSFTEIYHQDKILSIDHLANVNQVEVIQANRSEFLSSPVEDPTTMIDEAETFFEIIENDDRKQQQELMHLSKQVNQVLYDLRKSANIKFPSDNG